MCCNSLSVTEWCMLAEVEIKHCRIAMYATIGYIVPEYYKFPGMLAPSIDLKFSDVPNGLNAFSKAGPQTPRFRLVERHSGPPWQVPIMGWLQIVFFAGLIETSGFFSGSAKPIGYMRERPLFAHAFERACK